MGKRLHTNNFCLKLKEKNIFLKKDIFIVEVFLNKLKLNKLKFILTYLTKLKKWGIKN